MFSKIRDSLISVVYPQNCQICHNSVEMFADGVVCRECWEKSRIFSGNEVLCAKCGAFLKTSEINFTTFCHRCDEHFYDQAKAVGIYEKALAASIVNLKIIPYVSKNLQNLFYSAFETSDFRDVQMIIPVPLSKKRLIERGFNQAEVLAQILSNKTKIKIDDKSLVREVHTQIHRAGMDKKAREMSVKNAFVVKRANFIENQNILLIDDVFTSGATVSACAKALKKKGASKVFVLTVARAV